MFHKEGSTEEKFVGDMAGSFHSKREEKMDLAIQ